MSIGNQKTQGGKGSNYPYQLRNLELLSAISAGVAPPGGLATEATALQILSSIQNGRDFEQALVIDLGGAGCPANCPTYIQIRIYDPNTGTFGPPIYYNATGAVVVPVGPLEYINPQYLLQNILVELQAINTDIDVALSTRASEVTLAAVSATLTSIKTDTANLDVALSTRASESTLATASATLTSILGNLDVALSTRASEATLTALVTLLTGTSKVPTVVSAVVDGSTTAGVKSVSLWFRGNNGTLGGVSVPNGSRFTYSADDNNDTIASLSFTVPTTGESRIIITYLT